MYLVGYLLAISIFYVLIYSTAERDETGKYDEPLPDNHWIVTYSHGLFRRTRVKHHLYKDPAHSSMMANLTHASKETS